jgi:hypothetical protein
VDLDQLFRFVGDEDCGVGINCRECDRGGLPIAHYESWPDTPNPYADTDVVYVHKIVDLLAAAEDHARATHGPVAS